MWPTRRAALALGLSVFACAWMPTLAGCHGARSTDGATQHEGSDSGSSADSVDEGPGRASWGPRVPRLNPEALISAELARGASSSSLRSLLDAEPSLARERALWSLARIGGEEARERLLAELDRSADSQALAAAALLEVPPLSPDRPAEPLEGGPWGLLEDALWTRFAVTDPAASSHQRALLLAIARIGGPRSIARFAVELGERPLPQQPPEVTARWSAAAHALGLLCARGHGLDQGSAAALAAGLERRKGADPATSLAAIYAIGRCARSSAELLVESRELLVGRLVPHLVEAESPHHAALAWRALAALGDLPESSAIPSSILGVEPPPWTVEVEAVRALGVEARGRSLVRTRLRELPIEAFSGPRQHVLIASLQAMREGIGGDPRSADAELIGVSERLVEGRRSEDPRLRKATAIALCELRLLQAIRTGVSEELRRCHELPNAAPVELPTSLLVNFEVEGLLRATKSSTREDEGLGTAAIDDQAVIADELGASVDDPRRRARIARLLELARAPEAARATPALHALAELDDPSVLPVLRAALVRDDPGVLAAAATAIAVRSVDASKRDPEAAPLLEELVRDRDASTYIEARLAAIEALGVLARGAVTTLDPEQTGPPEGAPPRDPVNSPWLARSVVPLAGAPAVAVRRKAREALLGHEELLREFDRLALAASPEPPFDPRLATDVELYLAEDPSPRGLRVVTEVGAFTIEFEGVVAPINQANLVRLASEGYFDTLTFHRVVPGFVVQGGDPRGDGYGGPGYLVPCEWSNLRYERGTVGIALAGKDTGGSQFFVTQTPQPHLDARYTVVGQVDEGLEVIDLLLPGDRIESVTVISR